MKQYNGEKAIISLTSWKARINTVSKTLYSLIKQCPGFHIVLVLSEEEFPKKEAELPNDLMLFVNNDLIEILWIYKNYRSFKKILFTMDKYKTVPIISADDDCIYNFNYAQKLYDKWVSINKSNIIITNNPGNKHDFSWPNGPYTLYPPNIFANYISKITDKILNTNNDDAFYGCICKIEKIDIIGIHNKNIVVFHDNIKGLGDGPNKYCAKNDLTTIYNELNHDKSIYDMNLIGNSCVAPYIIRDCFKKGFNNPFCWAKIDFDSMYNLISKYDTINFKNVIFRKTGNFYTAIIDNLVKVQYIHYLEDPSKKEITYEKFNVVGPNILEFVKTKYFSRLEKMTEQPTFLLAAGYWQEYYVTDEQISKLINLNSKYTIIISMPNTERNKLKSTGNVKIHNHSFRMNIDGVHEKLAKHLAKFYWGIDTENEKSINNTGRPWDKQ